MPNSFLGSRKQEWDSFYLHLTLNKTSPFGLCDKDSLLNLHADADLYELPVLWLYFQLFLDKHPDSAYKKH